LLVPLGIGVLYDRHWDRVRHRRLAHGARMLYSLLLPLGIGVFYGCLMYWR
jgi:hypothetical protein